MSGETQITDGVSGYGRWEYEAKAGKDSSNEVRYAFAGLNFGDFGSFDYGRNDGVLKAITAYTDVLPEFGGDASNNDWYVLSARTKAVATYRNNNLFGLTDDVSFALQYADNGDNSKTKDGIINSKSREAFGANAQWNIFDTGLTLGGGYAQSTGSDKRHNTWTTGVQYDNYNLHLAANYFQSKIKDAEKYKGFELVAQYGFDLEVGRLTPSLAYVQHKEKKDGKSSPLVKYVSLGAAYDLNKNFSAIVEYKFNLLDRDDKGAMNNTTNSRGHGTKPGTKDVLGVGLIYQF
jgi:predicted porin